ncbi:YdcF family protein [Shewanella cyperi]|uniref:YdcF family protein n=1 Tax=Shewanella cyperi TaxID=2814292 RepID=UPI001A9521D1|nr:YdcF family protein [Shewanella cyperi]QSX39634.1 YdcF family protein [Shewanella cyperi]
MFWLKKILSLFVMPLPLVLLLILLAFILIRSRAKARFLLACAAVLLLVLSMPWGSKLLTAPLEAQYEVNRSPIEGSCQVMVLGSGHDDGIAGSVVQQLSPTALARLTEGLAQLRLGKDCVLIVSGWNGGRGRAHADVMAEAAVELGVAPDRILRLPEARDTLEEAEYLSQILGDVPVRLVTSATHMPRAMAIFKLRGIKAAPAPTDFYGRSGYWWRPDGSFLLASQRAIHEYVGLFWFWLRHA